MTFDDATTLSGDVEIDTNNDGATILFRSTVATGGNSITLDAGPLGDITISNSLTGGGSFTVRDGSVQSYQKLQVGSIDIKDATISVSFDGDVSAAGDINVTSGGLIIQSAPVQTAVNLAYAASQLNLGADITTSGNQIYNTAIFLLNNAKLSANSVQFCGTVTTNGNVSPLMLKDSSCLALMMLRTQLLRCCRSTWG